MLIDYSSVDRVFKLSFEKLDSSARMDFSKPGTLSGHFSALISALKDDSTAVPTLPHEHSLMLASAGVEMWHRAIHSFLWSVALTESSPLWSSVTGYYASHFVMRAFAHSMGIFKSFTQQMAVQVVMQKGHFVCTPLPKSNRVGEHAFYWKAVKGLPKLVSNPLFRENNSREDDKKEDKSDIFYRNFTNYTDHLDSFTALAFSSTNEVSQRVEKICRIRRHSVTAPTPQQGSFLDIDKVQILAFQRIVAFHDFLDEEVPKNRFWRKHRRPSWCRDIMLFQVEEERLEQPSVT